MKNLIGKIPGWAKVTVVVLLGLSLIGGLIYTLLGETKIQTVSKGQYVLWTRSGHAIKVLDSGKNELRGWQKDTDVLRNMGTENTLIAISNSSRRTQVEAAKLDPKTTVIKYIPSNMETMDGTVIQVYYNIWVKRDPTQLTRLFDERWELQVTAEMDGWVAAEVIKMTDEQLKNVDGRLQIMAPADESIKIRLAEKGLIFVLSEYHFQFNENPSQ